MGASDGRGGGADDRAPVNPMISGQFIAQLGLDRDKVPSWEDFPFCLSAVRHLDNIPRIGDAYGSRSLHEQSHGESFLSLMLNRFGGRGLYVLDEPEAALSPSRQMAVLSRMHDLVRQESQFVVATHSPIIMAYPDSIIYQLSDQGMEVVEYTETEHFSVAKGFLENHRRMLDLLLAD